IAADGDRLGSLVHFSVAFTALCTVAHERVSVARASKVHTIANRNATYAKQRRQRARLYGA
ncbi:MAG TPA: hypothetical protein VFS15_16485, partial [Kofleriaceae bacterium]|nr:hypothetical protein [Kofleriaceae bacterium]